MDNTKELILRQLTNPFRQMLSSVPFSGLEEIRFRVGRPICLYYHDRFCFLSENGATGNPLGIKTVLRDELDDLSSSLCNHSVYAYLNDMKDGFITIRGGHRVGLSGKCVMKDNLITGITNLSGINLRIAREYRGCASFLASHLKTAKGVRNTLLIAPPQCGKTTFLRDLSRIFSKNYKITIVDERSEIAGCAEGIPQFDVGLQTDVLDRFPKSGGMLLALRSLSPHIIMTDELGDEQDLKAVRRVCDAGCSLIASMHGDSLSELKKTKGEFLSYFDLAVMLGRSSGFPDVLTIENLR